MSSMYHSSLSTPCQLNDDANAVLWISEGTTGAPYSQTGCRTCRKAAQRSLLCLWKQCRRIIQQRVSSRIRPHRSIDISPIIAQHLKKQHVSCYDIAEYRKVLLHSCAAQELSTSAATPSVLTALQSTSAAAISCKSLQHFGERCCWNLQSEKSLQRIQHRKARRGHFSDQG